MQHDVITPNPDYKIPANLWDLNIAQCARAPSPLSTFIRHCNTMESPHFSTYSKQGAPAPAGDLLDLNYGTSSVENLRELQKYSKKLSMSQHAVVYGQKAFRRTSRMNRRKSRNGIAGMTEDLLRMKRTQYAQPHWVSPMLNPLQPAPPNVPSQQASSSSASMVPVKPAPLNRNPSMAAAPVKQPQ